MITKLMLVVYIYKVAVAIGWWGHQPIDEFTEVGFIQPLINVAKGL